MPLNNNDIQQLIEILQRGLTEDSGETPTKKRGRPTTPKSSAKKSVPKKSTKQIAQKSTQKSPKKSTNIFDSMKEKNMFKNDTEIDKLLSGNLSPSPRTRELEMVDVKCRACGEKDTVAKTLVLDKTRYKCNKCSMVAG